jgi:protein TonB
VIGASPTGVFDEAALRAVRRWRYNPKLENDVAVSRPGIRVRLRFELQRS